MTAKKKTVLLPTSYFGQIEYFFYLNMFKNIVIEQHETWPKQTFRNRTTIITDKGKQSLTVPVKKINGNHTKTLEIKISHREKWHLKHWRAIETAYRNSPYFLYYSDDIKNILFSTPSSLINLNNKLIKHICEVIGINCSITYSERFIKDTENDTLDLRYKISPKLSCTLKTFPEYIQVFTEKQPFIPNASILDLLFCLGPESKSYLDEMLLLNND
jgi:hypothetical protein